MLLLTNDLPGTALLPDATNSAAICAVEPLPVSALASQDHERMVRAYLAALTGDVDAVDDLSQEVFLRAIQRLHLLGGHTEPGRVLRGIARWVAHEFFRGRRRSRRYIE